MNSASPIECDIAVFGSGLAGLTAAIVAASQGLKVTLFEKAPWVGGTTATSGGVIWIPGNSLAKAEGLGDTEAAARTYLDTQLGASMRQDLVDAFLESGPEAVDYLARSTDIKFELAASPDYVTDAEGSALKGRALSPLPFDGRLLGERFDLVRPPRAEFMVLGGLMVGRREIPQLLRPFSSWSTFVHVARLLGRYAWDRMTRKRGTRLLMGNALVARALKSALDLGVDIKLKSELQSLIRERGRVTGAFVNSGGTRIQVSTKRGLVLATGGAAHSSHMRKRFHQVFPHRLSLAAEENNGDAFRAACAVGGIPDEQLESPGFWTPASVLDHPDGTETVFPYGHLDRGKPGAIIVNRKGKRFVNESDSYHHVVLGMFKAHAVEPGDGAFLICDEAFIRKYGLGMVRPAPFPKGRFIKDGYLFKADTLADLARQLDVDKANLEAEISRHNRFARTGVDQDFNKGASAFNRYNGDALGQPNPCLLPIDTAPYYAIKLHPCTLGTAVGLKTDADARVLDEREIPIDGLYACGNEMASVMRGAYPGPGITLGPALVFAYRAMRHAARSESRGYTAAAPAAQAVS